MRCSTECWPRTRTRASRARQRSPKASASSSVRSPLMPTTISLANRLAKKLAETRRSGELPFLRPDGKTQVTVEYEYGKPRRIEAVVISTHHAASATQKEIAEGVRELVIDPVLKGQVV